MPAQSQPDRQKGPWFNPRFCSAPLTLWLKRKEGTLTQMLPSCTSPGDLSDQVIQNRHCGCVLTSAELQPFPLDHTESWHTIRLYSRALGLVYSLDKMKHRRSASCKMESDLFAVSITLSYSPSSLSLCLFFKWDRWKEEVEEKRQKDRQWSEHCRSFLEGCHLCYGGDLAK